MDSFSMMAATATGFYQFKINHSKTKDVPIGEWITSPKFRVGPHGWVIYYYPQGDEKSNGNYVSVYLELQRESFDVTATFEFALGDMHGTLPSIATKEISHIFTSGDADLGIRNFFERTKLEQTYVKDSHFVLSVKITVIDESCTRARWCTDSISFLHERIKIFREENTCTDVTFDVDSNKFVAHRLILAAHSPVFEAELFGSMAESNMNCIKINEMIPSVFKVMLDFMYNGSLSVNEKLADCEGRMSCTAFLQHLLAAADRYAVEELIATCEYELSKSISLSTVLSTLELAEKHNCTELKENSLQVIVDKDNLVSLLLTEEYIELMQNYPSLLAELKYWNSRFSANVKTENK